MFKNIFGRWFSASPHVVDDVAMNARIDKQIAEDRAAFGLGPDSTARVLPVVQEEAARPAVDVAAKVADAAALLGRSPHQGSSVRPTRPVAETPRPRRTTPIVASVTDALDLRGIQERTK